MSVNPHNPNHRDAAAIEAESRRMCLESWPEAYSGGYHPSCCRFPKSCSIEAAPAPGRDDTTAAAGTPSIWPPSRIQRRRTKGWRLPEGARYVGRPTRWGNPFVIGTPYMWLGSTTLAWPIPTNRPVGEYEHKIRVEECLDAATAVEWFRAWAHGGDLIREISTELRGLDLACWCRLTDPCHADVLLEIANAPEVTP